MKFGFAGCSMTAGVGLPKASNWYSNIVANEYDASVVNVAEGGNSNQRIFMSALNMITDTNTDVLFVQWSAFNRYWLSPYPNKWVKLCGEIPAVVVDDVKENHHIDIKKFYYLIATMNHEFQQNIDVINYCKILHRLHDNVIFINGLLPWTKNISAGNFDDYTKKLFDFNNNPDNLLSKWISQLKSAFETIMNTHWINKFENLNLQCVDTGIDNVHPGIQSNQLTARKICQYLAKVKA